MFEISNKAEDILLCKFFKSAKQKYKMENYPKKRKKEKENRLPSSETEDAGKLDFYDKIYKI